MRLVTPDQIATAMREEAETGRPIAEIVVAKGWVSADDLARLQAPDTEPVPPVVGPTPAPQPEPVVAAPVAVVPPPASGEPAQAAPAPEPPVAAAPTSAPAPAPAPAAPAASPARVGARVLVRLENGERIQVGEFDGFEQAKARACGLMAELRQAAEWPFLSGRYVRPEAIVSIDVDLTSL